MWISDTSIRQPVFATMVISAIVVFGWVAYSSMGVDLFPKVDFPIVTVTTVLPGADPETVETDVTERLEEAINTISGIKSLRSQSSESVSIVIVEFELDRDVAQAAQDVRDKVAAVRRDLPDDVEPPVIDKLDPDAAPILAVALSGARSVREITEYADDVIKERLERVNGVGSVEIVGGREREIRVWLSMDRLSAYDLTVDDVVRALRLENLEVPGGRIETGPRELVVRTRGRIQHPDDFDRIVVMQTAHRPHLSQRRGPRRRRHGRRKESFPPQRGAGRFASHPETVRYQCRGRGARDQVRPRGDRNAPSRTTIPWSSPMTRRTTSKKTSTTSSST